MDSQLITEIEASLYTILINTYERRQWNIPCPIQHGRQDKFPLCLIQQNTDIIVCDIFDNTMYTLHTLLDAHNIDSDKILTDLDSSLQANRYDQVDLTIKFMYDKDSSGMYVLRWPIGNARTMLKLIYERVICDSIIRSLKLGEICKVINQS